VKRALAIIVTCLAIIGIASFAQRRPAVVSTAGDNPMACVDRMFTAASRGELESYIDCFGGTELASLQRTLGQDSADAAAESLRKTMSELRGWAVVDPPADSKDSLQCSLIVERIYTGRIDRQRMDLQRISGLWKICRVEQALPIQPPVPYGTHVSAQ
jgi:hypothetical protein